MTPMRPPGTFFLTAILPEISYPGRWVAQGMCPNRDISINYVPVPYAEGYPPATILMQPGEVQMCTASLLTTPALCLIEPDPIP